MTVRLDRCVETMAIYGKSIRCQGSQNPHMVHKAYINTKAGRTACLTWSSVDGPQTERQRVAAVASSILSGEDPELIPRRPLPGRAR